MSQTAPTMDIIVNEGRDRDVYRGTSDVEVFKSLPEYHGGVTMTIRVQHIEPELVATPITIDPNLHGGVPSIGHGQWPISHILQSLASGFLPERLTEEYPGLTLTDIQLALEAAAWVMREPAINWESLDLLEMTNFQREMRDWQGLNDDTIGNSEDD
jgi:uncharacterized protein (DUF433 family)